MLEGTEAWTNHVDAVSQRIVLVCESSLLLVCRMECKNDAYLLARRSG